MAAIEDVERLYRAAFDRPSDVDGLNYWVNSGWDTAQIAAYFSASPEFVAKYGALTDDAFVKQLYQNILGRAGDTGGITFWDDKLAAGYSRGNVLNGFAQSPENVDRSTPATPPVTPSDPPVAMPPPDPPMTLPPSVVPNDDIVGNLDHQTLTVTGFLHSGSIRDFTKVTVGVLGDFPNGTNGRLEVGGTLSGMLTITSVGNGFSSAEIATGAPDGPIDFFSFGSGGLSRLILDHPPAGHLPNVLASSGGGILELHGITFDGAKYVPGATGTGTGSLLLTEAGVPVYTLDQWSPSHSIGGVVGLALDGNSYVGSV